jgi:SAM-dependent methyltransferase
MISEQLHNHFYPDQSRDGAAEFYGWIRKYTNPQTVLLNLGAGPPAPRAQIRVFKGEVARVVGADIDPDVKNNPELDEAHIIENGHLPFADRNFDVVVSDWVLEHVEKPDLFLREVRRVLKPGGSYFFRTPNKYHYVGLIARATPDWFHKLVANRARGYPAGEHEPWPTYYRLNSRTAVEEEGSKAGFAPVEVRMWEYEPAYLVFNSIPYVLGVAYERAVNHSEALAGLRACIIGRMVRAD